MILYLSIGILVGIAFGFAWAAWSWNCLVGELRAENRKLEDKMKAYRHLYEPMSKEWVKLSTGVEL